jgi:hypothetical protein
MKLYGIAEIAEAFRVAPGTVAQWHHRGQLPEPDARLEIGPVWAEETFRAWKRSRHY